MPLQPKHHLEIHGQSIIQTIPKLDEKFITDVKDQNCVNFNVMQALTCYITQRVIKFLLIKLNLTTTIMKKKVRGIDENVKTFIEDLFHDNVTKPKQLIRALQTRNFELPSYAQIKNFLAQYKQRNLVHIL